MQEAECLICVPVYDTGLLGGEVVVESWKQASLISGQFAISLITS